MRKNEVKRDGNAPYTGDIHSLFARFYRRKKSDLDRRVYANAIVGIEKLW